MGEQVFSIMVMVLVVLCLPILALFCLLIPFIGAPLLLMYAMDSGNYWPIIIYMSAIVAGAVAGA
jgi:hypothetical protein